MEAPHILKNLLDTLFSSDVLKQWQIYEEHSGNICVKLRFNGRQAGLEVNPLQNARQGTFKRRSTTQSRRGQERATRHQMKTRSHSQVVAEEADELQGKSDIEGARCGEFTVNSPNCLVALNSLVSAFCPNPQPHEDPRPVTLSPHAPDFEPAYSQDDSTEVLPETEDDLESVDLPEPELNVGMSDYPDTCPDEDDDQTMKGCIYAACSYGTQGDEEGLDSNLLTSCNICKDMLKLNIHICDSCLAEGAHRGHRHWLTRPRLKRL